MILETFPVGLLACNCTIVGDEEAREAIVIDPGDEVSRIHQRLTELGLRLKQILITHAHIDHVGGALKLKRLTGAPIYLNENDLPLLKMMAAQAAWLGMQTPETESPDQSLNDGLVVGLAKYPAQVIHTPGHTQGSVCLHFSPLNLLVAGDTLFPEALVARICRVATTTRSSGQSTRRYSPCQMKLRCFRDMGLRPQSVRNAKVTHFCSVGDSFISDTTAYQIH